MDADSIVFHACWKRHGFKLYYFNGLKNVLYMLQTNYGIRFAALDFLYIFQTPFIMQTENLYLVVSKPILKQPIFSNPSIHTGKPVTKLKWCITTVMTVSPWFWLYYISLDIAPCCIGMSLLRKIWGGSSS